MNQGKLSLALLCFCTLALSACGGSGSGGGSSADAGNPSSGGDGSGGNSNAGRNISIAPGDNATNDALNAFIDARPGDVIEFACGFYNINKTLLLTATEDVTIKGCGMDDTVLSFRESNNPEGILVDSVRGVTIQDMTIADTDGNAFELRSVDHGTLQRVRAFWSSGGGRASPNPINAGNFREATQVACTDPATQNPSPPENALGDITSPDYTVSQESGRYGIYPVNSQNILIENSESIGASDAGIYVGQTNNAIIRNSRSAFNVFGFEIENVRGGEYDTNIAECNTGGFLIYDLDNLSQYGERSIMHGNISRMNNTYNFTEGGFVSNVPSGSGMITLAYDRIDVYDNTFEDNNTAGIIHTSYQVFPEGAGRPTDRRIDFYTEGMHIYNNRFINNGNGLPLPTTEDLQNQDVARVLPAVIGVKTQLACLQPENALTPECTNNGGVNFRGAHILWDGLLDSYDADCPYPKDANGQDVPKDANGKPIHTNTDPNPACHYNAYKFDTTQAGNPRIQPQYFASCIDNNNTFSGPSITYANFNGTQGIEALLIALDSDPVSALLNPGALQDVLAGLQNAPADFDMNPHDCQARYGANLPPIQPIVIPPFEPSGNIDPAPTPEEVAALCEVEMQPGQVNFDAAPVDCPRLDQYNLFADLDDPTSTPNSEGVPYVLNTKLFSDYAVKYRVAYMPPGSQATYSAPGANKPTATLEFPVGTIIAKTFSFPLNGEETAVETRLLIKRLNSSDMVIWNGLPYIWQTDSGGNRFATLQPAGTTVPASWDYEDVDTGIRHQGSTDSYLVPNANQCISCHANRDLEAGTAPIGPKVRNLNRPYESESLVVTDQSRHQIAGQNQIAYLCSTGRVAGCPQDLGVDTNTQVAENLDRLPKFNVAGDSGFTAGSDQDIEARTRAWLEVNCQHCHNPGGFAANTGYYLDKFRTVDTTYGICKGPTATGAEGSDGRSVDIRPGNANQSILEFRISPAADTPAARMPPIARSVVDTEAHALVRNWINNVVRVDETRYPGSSGCGAN